ncbi:MAG: hypothetical protein ACR2QH_14055 [Geminicoccaceae bacterium]
MPVIMTDRRLQQSWRVSLKRREIREIAVLDGLDRQDRDYAEHRDGSMTGQEFRQWQAEPPELPLEDMIASLLGDRVASTSADRIASLDGAADERAMFDESGVPDAAALPRAVGGSMSSMRQPIAPTGVVAGSSAIRNASIVEIVGQEDRGRGVYIAPAFVLVGSEVVEGQGLIDIEDGRARDGYGSRVLGLVAAVDRSRGLALVQVPRAGVPVMMEAAWSRPSEWSDRASRDRSDRSAVAGESGPILDGPYLLGFRSERGPDISLREIKAFLNEQDALLGSGVTAAFGSHSPGSKVFSERGDALSRR